MKRKAQSTKAKANTFASQKAKENRNKHRIQNTQNESWKLTEAESKRSKNAWFFGGQREIEEEDKLTTTALKNKTFDNVTIIFINIIIII